MHPLDLRKLALFATDKRQIIEYDKSRDIFLPHCKFAKSPLDWFKNKNKMS